VEVVPHGLGQGRGVDEKRAVFRCENGVTPEYLVAVN
jgi:hypothetical protein